MYRVSQNSYEQEQLFIKDDQISLRMSRSSKNCEWPLSRVTLVVFRAEKALDICRVFLKPIVDVGFQDLNDNGIELGVFLNQRDKEVLIDQLRPYMSLQYFSGRTASVKI